MKKGDIVKWTLPMPDMSWHEERGLGLILATDDDCRQKTPGLSLSSGHIAEVMWSNGDFWRHSTLELELVLAI